MGRFYTNRTICDCLNEMRELTKTLNFSPILGLVEEIQTMANRMEARLDENKQIEGGYKVKKQLKEEIKLLEIKLKNLKQEETE